MNDERSFTRADLPEALCRALDAAVDRGARVPVVLRMTERAGYTDWVMLLSGRSDRNVHGIVEGITDALTASGREPLGTDGLAESSWALLDYDDFLIHAFYHPVRTFYDLEGMWSDAPRVALGLPEEIMSTKDLVDLEAPVPMPGFRGGAGFGGFDDEFDDDLDDEYDDLETDDDAEADDDDRDVPAGDGGKPPDDDEADDDDDSLFEE